MYHKITTEINVVHVITFPGPILERKDMHMIFLEKVQKKIKKGKKGQII